jgi:endonuclease III
MAPESLADRKARAAKIVAILKKTYPDARCSLDFTSPLELIVATILAAQCTDVRVNIVTKDLFRKYRSVSDYANAPEGVLEDDIRSTGFYNNKAKSIRGMAQRLLSEYGGQVPKSMDELLTLPGVARKTANVVLSAAYGINVGVIVDTHVTRLSGRLKLSAATQPEKIEQDLMQLVPQADWAALSHCLVFHGRTLCTARKPDCAGCPINKLCPSAFKV